ncbi:hypothetical protein COW36_17845 [bacterium (Candidatus Blackallbacteria) CG17_big_fil_post_rev_8_21_14_2_50_48_46]|uniref:Uncharacterized protein n=1 Tax=bacterium (Candidatus Blackallbacteria) CG17_big_fil_post_rev_8_21_14_2_50_48_46 TaxID=2014261 RepID=A0A2M7G0S6_9BACT|nr:MAG: hypothetical protein COW64_00880 [bacterium (Candidatus Blackallbacteria) CG18_big_fil_WC_8_21_14_2_50_49_26]PIW15279.1 MAG: hypothetical protein COW36_17845 [bacterium (Candidatus Blackallbacteria) CG17_big_fil_post_rev_8_21_14_2_50_48_46]PIW45212.1 MAG: hypothetical protein COW20_21170 [bacterium (Candidatus Blackallbacteria) CG13_big_fil_rev_8_21_14_2_50_49_14]
MTKSKQNTQPRIRLRKFTAKDDLKLFQMSQEKSLLEFLPAFNFSNKSIRNCIIKLESGYSKYKLIQASKQTLVQLSF